MTLTPKKFKRVTLLNYRLEFPFCVCDFGGVVVAEEVFCAEVSGCSDVVGALWFEEGLCVPVEVVWVIDGDGDAGAVKLQKECFEFVKIVGCPFGAALHFLVLFSAGVVGRVGIDAEVFGVEAEEAFEEGAVGLLLEFDVLNAVVDYRKDFSEVCAEDGDLGLSFIGVAFEAAEGVVFARK